MGSLVVMKRQKKRYRVFILETKNTIFFRSVLFDENTMWSWTIENEVSRPIPMNLQLNENLDEIENVEMDAVARPSQL